MDRDHTPPDELDVSPSHPTTELLAEIQGVKDILRRIRCCDSVPDLLTGWRVSL
ncbi:MAG: hypothetical protein OWU33_15405 [Firmicutes bacterium]|nr:hypothetical protein [Bacillota bacterium]